MNHHNNSTQNVRITKKTLLSEYLQKLYKSKYLQNLLDIFSQIDKSKKFCEINFYECTKFYLLNEKKGRTNAR